MVTARAECRREKDIGRPARESVTIPQDLTAQTCWLLTAGIRGGIWLVPLAAQPGDKDCQLLGRQAICRRILSIARKGRHAVVQLGIESFMFWIRNERSHPVARSVAG